MEIEQIKFDICQKFREKNGSRKPETKDVAQIDHYIATMYLLQHIVNPNHLWWVIHHVKHTNDQYDLLVKKANGMSKAISSQDKLTWPVVQNFIYGLALTGLRLDIIAELS